MSKTSHPTWTLRRFVDNDFTMSLKRVFGVTVCAILLSACGNDSSYNNTNLGSVSIGQQLIDLRAAKNDGLLTEKEYRELRTKLLRALSNSLDRSTRTTSDDLSSDAHTDAGAENSDDNEAEEGAFDWLF